MKGVKILLYIWLIVAGFLFIVELFTAGVLAVWFAIGALLAAITAFIIKDSLVAQIFVFTISSALLTLFGIKVLKKSPTKSSTKAQRVYSIIDKTAVVTKEINTNNGVGQISVNGDLWAAKTESLDVIIPENAKVKVVSIDGVKAVVELLNK